MARFSSVLSSLRPIGGPAGAWLVSSLAVVAVGALGAVGGCGSSATSFVADAGASGGDSGLTDGATDGAADAGADVLVFGDAAAGEPYRQGDYICCGLGGGTACCPPGTLADPSAGTSSTCFQYGGVIGRCTPEESSLEAKDICSICCEGLVRIESTVPDRETGTCIRVDPPSVFVCAACGDKTCGPGENSCNCPADCPQ